MSNIWKVLKKFTCAFFAFISYLFLLPMFIVGWTVYGFFRGITVWAWNVIEVGVPAKNDDCWEFNIPSHKQIHRKLKNRLTDPYERLHLTIDPSNTSFDFVQAFLGCAVDYGYTHVSDSVYDNLENVFLIRRKDRLNVQSNATTK